MFNDSSKIKRHLWLQSRNQLTLDFLTSLVNEHPKFKVPVLSKLQYMPVQVPIAELLHPT